MEIGLYDADSHNFPNLPLMKLSAWHKRNGDNVNFWRKEEQYDRVYISKIFTCTPEPTVTNTAEIIRGGSGYDLENKLPPEIEHIYPDYALYNCNFAIGFLTRGCPRKNHDFCITPKKDGCKSIKVADVTEFWDRQKQITLLDQNLLACRDRIDLLEQLASTGAVVDFIGGLDARFLSDEIIDKLREIKTKSYYFAWDDPREDLLKKFKLLTDSDLVRPDKITVYVLTNYWSDHNQDLMRIYKLRSLGLMPYVMIYDKQLFVDSRGRWLPDVATRYNADELRRFKICQHLQRWCNTRQVIKAVHNFDNYEPYKKWSENGKPIPQALNQLTLWRS